MAPERPGVIPMIAYEDGVAALDWLAEAFGFTERTRLVDEHGRISHGEMETDHGVIMLASPSPDYEGPRKHQAGCDAARRCPTVPWIVDGVLVLVDDLDEHCRRALAHGATILSEPEDGGPGRRYRAEDLEGHRWMFLQQS